MGEISEEGARALDELEAALPVEDLLAWLIEKLPEADEQEVFATLRGAYQRGWRIEPASAEMRTYAVGERTIEACAQRAFPRA